MNVGEALKAFQERFHDSMISFVCLGTVRCSIHDQAAGAALFILLPETKPWN